MTTQRDHLFPATSIGRTQGHLLSRTPSNESLTAHPLLSPTGDSPQRYVPYTPRQRLPTTTATTTTNVLPSASTSNTQHQGDATSKLQLMNLKAAAQNIGLDTGTVGWAILEKLASETESVEEWVDIWSAVTNGKVRTVAVLAKSEAEPYRQATLLLPLEPATNERITADFVKDHIVLCDGASRKDAPIVTLSGLRGVLNKYALTSLPLTVLTKFKHDAYLSIFPSPFVKVLPRNSSPFHTIHNTRKPTSFTSSDDCVSFFPGTITYYVFTCSTSCETPTASSTISASVAFSKSFRVSLWS